MQVQSLGQEDPLENGMDEDGGVSGVSSSCGARGGFLPRHDEDLKEPLVRKGHIFYLRQLFRVSYCDTQ